MLSVLHCSAFSLQPKVMRFLLELGVDANETDMVGNSALHLTIGTYSNMKSSSSSEACGHFCEEIVKLLLNQKVNVNLKNIWQETPMHIASRTNNSCILNLLLQHRGKINEKDCKGRNALHIASEFGFVGNIVALLNRGQRKCALNVDDRTNAGDTALLLAARSGHTAAVGLLLENHANINACNNS